MDSCIVFTNGGIVLWEKHFQEGSIKKVVTSFVNEALIEKTPVGYNEIDSYHNSGYTVRFTIVNDLGLVFAVVYQSILQLPYVEELLQNLNKIFVTMFADRLKEQAESRLVLNIDEPDLEDRVARFTSMIEARLGELEKETSTRSARTDGPLFTKAKAEANATKTQQEVSAAGLSDEEIGAKDSETSGVGTPTSLSSRRRRGGKKSKQNQENTKDAASKPKKQMRRWGEDGMIDDYGDEGPLDYSMDDVNASSTGNLSINNSMVNETVGDMKNWGSTQKDGLFVLNELHSILEDGDGTSKSGSTISGGSSGAGRKAFGFLQNLVGGKTITSDDLDRTLEAMETHLLQKNVAKEAAEHLCSVVRKSLVGAKTQNWTTVQATVKSSMSEALRQILTPNTSLDLLHEIELKVKSGSKKRPYVISVVGVNGVGKSTNLSKIAFWLLQNKMKVLIAACDTFRSGAVEQLKVHVSRLQELTSRLGAGEVDIFTEGYGKDAAVIAQRAIEFGQREGFDVVLIDTAGRRHNDDRLMSSLEKFGKLANPDKIIMVGEALVGTDSVQQARNFNAAFGKSRDLDFFLISKCDTVGDMIGSMVNMTYSTGIPVLFVGVGQNYTDLRTLSIDWAVDLLMG